MSHGAHANDTAHSHVQAKAVTRPAKHQKINKWNLRDSHVAFAMQSHDDRTDENSRKSAIW